MSCPEIRKTFWMLDLEDVTGRLSRNISEELPLLAAY